MNVRFREPYSDSNPRMSYELVEGHFYDYNMEEKIRYYNTKLIGLVPTYKMEITTDPTDIPATVVFEALDKM